MVKTRLHPGARWLFRVSFYSTFIIAIILLLFFGVSMFFNATRTSANLSSIFIFIILLAIAGLLLVIIIGEIYARMSYNRWFYEFTNTNLKLERGIIWKRYSNIPYERVQNVDIQRGVIARIFGFSSINIQTAGYSMPARGLGGTTEGYIPAVSIEDAERIREFVIKKTHKNFSDGL
ncbi:MAG: PH domain-containing protein [Nanoarchaeota archaeon]